MKMMSFYKHKISAKNVRISEHSKAVNDRHFEDESTFEDIYVEEKREGVQARIQQIEQEMMQELEDKRQFFIDQAYQEGKQKAEEEAQKQVEARLQQKLADARALFEESNEYRKQVIEQAEQDRNKWLEKNAESCLSLVLDLTEQVIRYHVPAESIPMDALYEEAMKKVTYDTKKIYVRVHPSVKKWIETKGLGHDDRRIEVFYDSNIEPGDLFIETDKEYMDASIASKLQNLKERLRGVVNATD